MKTRMNWGDTQTKNAKVTIGVRGELLLTFGHGAFVFTHILENVKLLDHLEVGVIAQKKG